MGRRAQRLRYAADGSVLRGHRCEDCGQLFLSAQRVVGATEAEDIESLIAATDTPSDDQPIYSPKRIEAEGLSPLGYFQADARRRGLSIRAYEDEAGIHLMPAQKEIAAHEVGGDLDRFDAGDVVA